MNKYMPEGSLMNTHTNCELISNRSGLEYALQNGVILEAPAVICDHNFDLHIELPCGMTGIIPKSEVQHSTNGEPTKDIAILTRVGKPVCFKVIGFKKDASGVDMAILSRRSAQIDCVAHYISTLISGDIIPARVTHLENFGAFADIGCGIIALLSIDCISVSRISHPAVRLATGDTIYAVIKNIDDVGRIYISTKELLGTWEENAACFKEGETVRGIIRSIEDYGVFVELKPNLAGLAEYQGDVRVGQTAAVYIKSIIPEKMKIKLIIIDVSSAPTAAVPLNYFVNPNIVKHITAWKYSPNLCKRTIESVF